MRPCFIAAVFCCWTMLISSGLCNGLNSSNLESRVAVMVLFAHVLSAKHSCFVSSLNNGSHTMLNFEFNSHPWSSERARFILLRSHAGNLVHAEFAQGCC